MIIHVKNLKDGKIFNVKIDPNATTDDVKAAVEQHQQRAGGCRLRDRARPGSGGSGQAKLRDIG